MKTRLFFFGISAFAFVLLLVGYCLIPLHFVTGSDEERSVAKSTEDAEPTDAIAAHQWRMLAWQDENGNIPPGGLAAVLTARETYLTQNLDPNGFGERPISPLNWVSRGPDNVGGRTGSVVLHPDFANNHTMWAGSTSGGVWKSTDGGDSWFSSSAGLGNPAVGAMAIAPDNPNVLYAGTGADFDGSGIFKTSDGGMSWTRINGSSNWAGVYRIAIARTNNVNVLLVATNQGVYRSENAGGSFDQVIGTPSNPIFSQQVAFDPNNPSKAVAVVQPPGSNYTTRYSTNGGLSWFDSNLSSPNRIELAYVKSQVDKIFGLTNGGNGYEVIKVSANGGQDFTSVTSSYPDFDPVRLDPSTHANMIWAGYPRNPNFIIAGGQQLFRSTDGGSTFVRISDGYVFDGQQPHVDQLCGVADPNFNGTTNKRIYFCNDGGVYATDDIATVSRFEPSIWRKKTFNYRTSQYYGAAGQGSAGMLLGGAQDNGSPLSYTWNSSAVPRVGGDGGFAAIDSSNAGYYYAEWQWLHLHRFRVISPQETEDIGILDGPAGARFIAPFVLDPNNQSRLYAGSNQLLRNNDVKQTPLAFTPIFSPGQPISAIAVAPGNSNIIWVGVGDPGNSSVWKTENGLAENPSWTHVSPLPSRMIDRIVIDPSGSNIVYVALGGMLSNGNLQKTTCGGVQTNKCPNPWTDITGTNFPDAPVRGIARHPTNPNKLYVATEVGLYSTQNGGTDWQMEVQGPGNVPVDEVSFISGTTTLLAGTYGRGLWTADVTETVHHTAYDFDGDGRSDISVFRPDPSPSPNGSWYIQPSGGGFVGQQFGLRSDIPAAADFDGDGKTDICVFRPSNATWYWIRSSNGTGGILQFGQTGDVPVPADFDGDGHADQAVFHPNMQDGKGYWQVHPSGGGPDLNDQWGVYDDLPTALDFNGDGHADYGVFRLKDGYWWLFESGNWRGVQWGQVGDIPSAADYTGDGTADIAIFRPMQNENRGDWYILVSIDPYVYQYVGWGYYNDIPVPADYDGDGVADIAVFRPSEGNWYIRQTGGGGNYFTHFGANGDIPIEMRRFTP
jgi:photosystem II stability/assembly factor-like uncharacterized protein